VIKPLAIVQKRALKLALNKPKDTPKELVFQLAKVHDLKIIHRIQTSIFMYKYHSTLLPRGFYDKFEKMRNTIVIIQECLNFTIYLR